MKKNFFYFLTLLCGFSVLSCNDKETPQEEEVVMNEADQKSYIEQVAIDLAGKMPSKDFEELKSFVFDLSGIYADSSWAQVGDSMMLSYMKCFEKVDEKEGVDTIISHHFYTGSEVIDTSYLSAHVDYYNVALTLSNFTGHYTLTDSCWAFEEAGDLQFNFKDNKNNDCVLKLSKEGKEVRMKVGTRTEMVRAVRAANRNFFTWGYFNEYEFFVCVPEKVNITLTRNDESVTSLTVKTDIKNLTEDGYFDLGNSSSIGSLEFTLNNGYKLTYETKATANDKLALNYSLSNAAGELFSYTISGDPSAIPSIVFNEDFSKREVIREIQQANSNIRNAYMCLSIDNKVKMIGKIADLRALLVIEDSINRNWKNEEKYKAFLEEENKHLDLGLYYGDSQKKQASIEAEAYLKEVDRYGDENWNTRLVLVFSDSTRTSFEEFFSKKDFTKAIEAFEALDEEYEKFIRGAE